MDSVISTWLRIEEIMVKMLLNCLHSPWESGLALHPIAQVQILYRLPQSDIDLIRATFRNFREVMSAPHLYPRSLRIHKLLLFLSCNNMESELYFQDPNTAQGPLVFFFRAFVRWLCMLLRWWPPVSVQRSLLMSDVNLLLDLFLTIHPGQWLLVVRVCGRI